MEQDKALRLLLRQLKDVQAQADRILKGESSSESIETFARYSIELKSYISTHVNSQEITSYLAELPEINYTRTDIKLWQYLILPSWWITLYKDYHAKNRTIEEINSVRGKYATLELLVKGLAE
ncbi:MAG TPA: hypothetical protein VD884_15275 [Ohtaekwangia sp.]|nr:hypothetical protein [Ohtaekwangia sp.]